MLQVQKFNLEPNTYKYKIGNSYTDETGHDCIDVMYIRKADKARFDITFIINVTD